MPVIQGNTSGSITTVGYNIPAVISSFLLINKSGGSITVNVFINTNGTAVNIIPFNLSIASGGSYTWSENIKLNAGAVIAIITSGSLDYYINIE